MGFESVLIDPKTSLKETMKVIDDAPHKGAVPGIAVIVDEDRRLLGVVTDGDIRRAILRGVSLDSAVEDVMTRSPVTVRGGLSNSDMLEEVSRKAREISRVRGGEVRISSIVVIDGLDKVVDVVSFFDLWKRGELKTREIAVLGLGFVGLTLALSLADAGLSIIGVDRDEEVVRSLKQGVPHFRETGLETLLKFHLGRRFTVKTVLDPRESDIYIISVQTPLDEVKRPTLTHVEEASIDIGRMLKKNDLVIVRSTVPVGTCRSLVLPILERESGLKGGRDFFLAMAPERTTEGQALKELRELPQIIGGLDSTSSELTSNLFRKLTPTIVNVNSLEEAELIKLMDNTYRDVTFAYANEIALLCDRLKIDAARIVRAANEGYPRNNIPVPSPGVGGVCLKKDPYIFMDVSRRTGFDPKLVKIAREINEGMVTHVVRKLMGFLERTGKDLREVKIFVIGFAFKGVPETSDTRDSTTIDLVNELRRYSSNLYGYDPVVEADEIRRIGVKPSSLSEGFNGADCVLVMNNHASYVKMDIYGLLESMKKPGYFFDGWRIFSKETVSKVEGITYDSVSSY